MARRRAPHPFSRQAARTKTRFGAERGLACRAMRSTQASGPEHTRGHLPDPRPRRSLIPRNLCSTASAELGPDASSLRLWRRSFCLRTCVHYTLTSASARRVPRRFLAAPKQSRAAPARPGGMVFGGGSNFPTTAPSLTYFSRITCCFFLFFSIQQQPSPLREL